MKKIVYKTIDGVICKATLVDENCSTLIRVKNVNMENVSTALYVPNIKDSSAAYMGELTVYRDKIIWYYIAE